MSIMTEYKANYNALMGLPLVRNLVKQNKKLSKRNKALENLIYSLPEFRTNKHCCCCCDTADHGNKRINIDDVVIKVEKDSSNSAVATAAGDQDVPFQVSVTFEPVQ